MNAEYLCKAWVKGRLVPVSVSYELDGYKPLIYGIFGPDDEDVTLYVYEQEFDRIYSEIMTQAQEGIEQ